MQKHHVEASATIRSAPKLVYAVLADYHSGHPNIVPRKYFKKLEVERGGVGAGTQLLGVMRVLGTTRTFRHIVSEPEPGRVLVESDVDGSTVTTFTVDAVDDGSSTHLTIATDFQLEHDGLLGAIERALISFKFPRIYREEIAILSEFVSKQHGSSGSD